MTKRILLPVLAALVVSACAATGNDSSAWTAWRALCVRSIPVSPSPWITGPIALILISTATGLSYASGVVEPTDLIP